MQQGVFYPPDDPPKWPVWREQLKAWRESTRYLMGYDDSLYRLPEFAWVPRAFSLGFLMMNDLQFYDPAAGQYRLTQLLDEAVEDFGGFDAVILWHAYPRIGLDDRNQFDFYRESIGGLEGLRALVDVCHGRGVKVYIDYNPWDTGTRREADSDVEALVKLVKAIDADAIFLDTMSFGAEELRSRLDEIRPGVTLESENLLPLEYLHTHPSSWAQGIPSGKVPGVLRNKWFERRHMQHRIKRWQHDHTEELHLAWMNGTGVVVWENVFGTSVLWSARDKSLLRSMLPIQRRYADVFSGEGWYPLVETASLDVCASRWDGEGIQLWTICNLTHVDFSGHMLTIPTQKEYQLFDLIRGQAITAGEVVGSICPRGIGAVIALHESLIDDSFYAFLEGQKRLDARADFDPTFPVYEEKLTPVVRTKPYEDIPEGMVAVPGRRFDLKVQFRVRECGFYQVEGVPAPDLRFRNLHIPGSISRPVDIAPFAMDITPVTNAQFAAFLQQTGYVPRDRQNFLKHWSDGQLPTALEDHPVVYVALEDMRAWAQWAGKRLPTEEEWQHAAQGFDELLYPWGNEFVADYCNQGAGTTPVRAFPAGRSPFGCYDMCGNVWEATESERNDGRTRAIILKGGSFYKAAGSDWYMDGGAQPNNFSAKMPLSWLGLDRCATVGFRCMVDLA